MVRPNPNAVRAPLYVFRGPAVNAPAHVWLMAVEAKPGARPIIGDRLEIPAGCVACIAFLPADRADEIGAEIPAGQSS